MGAGPGRYAVGMLLVATMVGGNAAATVTLTTSRPDTLYTTDMQFDCGGLAGLADADLPYNVVRIRADDDTGQATSFRWKLPKPNIGFFLPDDPEINSSAGGAFAVRGFCAEFGSGCVLTSESIRTYQRPTILWAAPTCESIPDKTSRPFDGDRVRIRVTAKNGRQRVGKASVEVSYGMLGTPTLFVTTREHGNITVSEGQGQPQVQTFVNPIFSLLLDPAIAASTPRPIKEWFIDNGQGTAIRTDTCPFSGDGVAPGAQACDQIEYTAGGSYVARGEVRLDDDSAYCDKLRVQVGQCRGRARVDIVRNPKKRTYASGEQVGFAVEFKNLSPPNGCVLSFKQLHCNATFKLGALEESGSMMFVPAVCKDEQSRLCEVDSDCIVLGIDRGPCLNTSHCSQTTEQPCDSNIDCRTAACPTCRENESCIRVLSLTRSLLENGVAPGERVRLLEDTIEVRSVLPGKAKVSETWTVDTGNLASFSGNVTYKIRGEPPR